MKTNTPCPRCGKTNPADVHTCTPKEVMEQELKEQDQKADLNEKFEPDCYGDGTVFHGVRSKDSNIKTIFFSSNSEPAKKPMNGDELLEGFDAAECSGLRSFTEGVRWAEKFHGIGVEEE